jgi:serine/threonine-protein kinase
MGEQATALSDIYALGVVAYQCLAGRRPFEGENPLEIAMRHVRETPPLLPPDIPPQVRAIVERAMAKDPASRWPTAAAFAGIARRCAADLAAANPRPGIVPPPPGVAAVAHPPVSGSPTPVSVPPKPPAIAQPIGVRPVAANPPMVAPGYRPGPAPVPVPPGYLGAPVAPARPPRQASTGLIVAIIVAVVIVAICIGAGIAILQNQRNNSNSRSLGATSVTVTGWGDGVAGGVRGTVGQVRTVGDGVVSRDEGRLGS